MQRKSFVLIVVLVTMLVITMGVEAKLTGEEILDEVDSTLSSETRDSVIDMTIVNSNGQERDRTITIKTKGETRGLVKFLKPADVKDTALLTRKEDGEENMWLYLPTVGNVRKIASHMKSGKFMGTDFTYNDIDMVGDSNYQEDYESTLEGEEEINGDLCYKLITNPTSDEIDYSKMVMWVRKSDYVPLKLEFFDQEGDLQKIMRNKDIKDIDGHLVPHQVVMENVQENTKTILHLQEINFDKKLPERIFTTRNIKNN